MRAENIVLYLLLFALTAEFIYIIFRYSKFSDLTIFLYSATVLVSLYSFASAVTFFGAVKLSSVILLLCAKAYLKNKPFEKPDWRYLLILGGAIFIHI